jgi:hypothetical protein
VLQDSHELVLPDVCKNHPMKSLSTLCLGSTAAGVMVGSTGLAIEGCHKAEANDKSENSRFDICYNGCHFSSQKKRKAEVLSRRGAG